MLIISTQLMHHTGLSKQTTMTTVASLGLGKILMLGGEYNLMEDQS